MAVLAAIAVLAILIVVHELGHFTAARLQGIYANRFSIGFGPTLWKYQGKDTEYALRAFPLGGFVGFPDDDPEAYGVDPHDPNLLKNRPVMDRVIVISAGVIANLIFAYLLLVTQLSISGISEFNPLPGVLISEVRADVISVAADAGIKPRDIVLAANGEQLPASETSDQQLTKIIQSRPGQPTEFKIQRGEQVVSITATPKLDEGKGKIGVGLRSNGTVKQRSVSSPVEAITKAASEFQRITVLTVQGFGQLVTNFGQMANQVAGPVKIAAEGAKLAKSDPLNLLTFGALISINLAVINILPLPALDGGHLVFLLLEAVRGKPVPNRLQEGVMQTGLMLLLGLGIFLIIRDTANLIPQ